MEAVKYKIIQRIFECFEIQNHERLAQLLIFLAVKEEALEEGTTGVWTVMKNLSSSPNQVSQACF